VALAGETRAGVHFAWANVLRGLERVETAETIKGLIISGSGQEAYWAQACRENGTQAQTRQQNTRPDRQQ
jgi:hypothetical protein